MKHIKGLDTLRALAVIWVIAAHWNMFFYGTTLAGYFVRICIVPDGATAVYLFFVLSGFLITRILLNAQNKNSFKNNPSIIKNFFVRRTLRIFPIYYLCILWAYSQFPDVKQHINYFLCYACNILCYRTGTWNSASHTWTLAVEEQFYIFWPWLILYTRRKYLTTVLIACIIVGIITTYFTLKVTFEPFFVFNCLDSFGLGALYASLFLDPIKRTKFERIIKILAIFALAIYIYWKMMAYNLQFDFPVIFMKKTVDSILALWLIIITVNNKSERARKYFFENKFLNFIGTISYGIYLYHIYVGVLLYHYVDFINSAVATHHRLHDILITRGCMYIILLIILIAISWLSYKLIEQPILRLKKLFKYNSG